MDHLEKIYTFLKDSLTIVHILHEIFVILNVKRMFVLIS